MSRITDLIIRPLAQALFKAVDQQIVEENGKCYQEVYWVQCDADGNFLHDRQPQIQRCLLKEGQDMIDVSKLSDDCLNNLGK